jgi:hypothetical protein
MDFIGQRCMEMVKVMLPHALNPKNWNISQKNVMPLNYNLKIDLFDVWGIDFYGAFENSHGYDHIPVMVDYVSKWVEVIPCRKASTEESITMIKSVIFPSLRYSKNLDK